MTLTIADIGAIVGIFATLGSFGLFLFHVITERQLLKHRIELAKEMDAKYLTIERYTIEKNK